MHKFFAKPLFLGKKVEFLPQCHSTNDELTNIVKKGNQPEGLILYTDHQQKGKGQRGNIWLDEPGKNILMSIYLKPKNLAIGIQYYLTLIAGLAVTDAIQKYLDARIELKWPNDVYVNGRKISGILIENNLRGTLIESSIVGIGLNLNQQGFSLPSATSIFLETNSLTVREECMEEIVASLEKWYLKLNAGLLNEIRSAYHERLMWKNEIHCFKANNGEFEGVILGIDEHGRLEVEDRSGVKRCFNVKEVEFLS